MSSSNSSRWSCTVLLHQDYDYKPPKRPVKEADVTETNPLPPWHKKQVRDTKLFKTIYEQNSTEFELVLGWAQIATLNPSHNHEQYIPGEGVYAKVPSLEYARNNVEASFSPNIVALEIKGPGLIDLSFYDLPGIFANAENKDDDYLVKVVKNLTLSYISRPEAIIMLALPIDVDKENSMTMKTIRDAEAEARTIGVITKADRLGTDKVHAWLDILQGKKETVGHGCFVTSLPPDKRLDSLTSWEESFFRRETGVWPNTFDGFRDRCGVIQLRQYLTKQLGDAFSRSMPSIKKDLEGALVAVEADLDSLPELPHNVKLVVRNRLLDFNRRVKAAVTNSDFESKLKALNTKFHQTIVKMKPLCSGIIATAPIEIQDSDSETLVPVSSKRRAPNDHTMYETPTTKRFRQGSTPIKQRTRSTAMAALVSPSTAGTPLPEHEFDNMFDACLENRSRMHVDDIRKEIDSKTRAGFANIVPLEVHETLCLQAIQKWEGPLNIYIDKSMEMLASSVSQALESSFSDLHRRRIFKESQAHLKTYLDEHKASQRTRLVGLFENETYRMDTINRKSIEQFKAQELEVLGSTRAFSRAQAASLTDSKKAIQPLETLSAEEGVKQKKLINDWLAKLPEDPYKMEIEVAATVRAYYLTAATRFVDGVTMDVNSRLFRRLREGSLDDYLNNELGLPPDPPRTVYDHDHLMEEEAATAVKRKPPREVVYDHLMEEDAATAARCKQLKDKRDKLREAIESILQLEDRPGSNLFCRHVKPQERAADPIGATNEIPGNPY